MAAAEPFVVDGSTITISAAVGCCATEHTDAAALLREADRRMYEGKRRRRPPRRRTGEPGGDVVPAWICARCAVQYPDTPQPPPSCPICEDEREAVPPGGQRWTHMAELGRDHRTDIRTEEPGLTGIGVTPEFGIGQRALLVRTPAGNVLWDCIPLLDEQGRRAIDELGGLSAICLSHPHFYAAHLEFAEAFDAPVFLPRADERWIPRRSPRIELFDDEVEPVPGVTVARTGGPLRRRVRAALAGRVRTGAERC